MTNQGGNRGAGQAAAQEGSALQGLPRRAQGRPASGRAGVVDVGAGPDHNGHRLVRDGGGQGERAVRGALVRAPGIQFNRKTFLLVFFCIKIGFRLLFQYVICVNYCRAG